MRTLQSRPLPHDAEALLRQAYRLLDQGDAEAARRMAQGVLHQAQAEDDDLARAAALACMACGDRLVSRLRRAHGASQRAAQLFQQLGDLAGEAMSLTTLAHTASNLGRNEEAVEAALLSVRLSDQLALGSQRALAQNYLGVAYVWSRRFDLARAAFEAAARLAAGCEPPVSPVQPEGNLSFLEVLQLATDRFYAGVLPDTAHFQRRMARCLQSQRTWGGEGLSPGTTVTGRAMIHFLSSLGHGWSGEWRAAAAERDAGLQWARRYKTPTWLLAMHEWVGAELAWARQDWPRAESHVAAMTAVAIQVEHEQIACLGHMLASQILAQQGKHARALEELHRARRREELIRVESLESRARVVRWQLEMRRSTQTLRRVESASRQFERLSLEDPLTGLANRRCLDTRLAEMLRSGADSGQPLSIAFIDIDHFKEVNDVFSHQVGDEVLRCLARILAGEVRERDLPARLSGDEFVVVFPRSDPLVAQQVCERV
ncbi:MAG TPA: GGDEF domain-containing protein, partial [Albitalea sp.]|nr:GGDEF domain-containing protein [Albitalea sp.]